MPVPVHDACRSGAPGGGPETTCSYCVPGADGTSAGQPPAGDGLGSARLTHLYLCRGLSTYSIAERAGLDRQRVTRALRAAGVQLRPRGAGRLRPERTPGDPRLPQLMRQLYEDARLSSRQIAAVVGMPERTVRDRLHRYRITPRTRGGWNREDRTIVPAHVLGLLYSELGLTAAEVGQRLGVSPNTVLRSAHALGVPVRSGGAVPLAGPEEIELLSALYADPLVDAALSVHDIPRIPVGGALSQRFPEPVQLTTPLVKDLYWGCGVGLNHVELLTGQAAESVRGFMRRAGIPLRPPGGRSPFLRRWRAGAAKNTSRHQPPDARGTFAA